ncbi:MAG: hypothetical protein GDA42_00540 [Ekhidna sp.]|nr:hypothetical protein [Ekhidna sp.]MBC6408948.1 hypothetical protein [Ekhidna sp.]
MKKTSNIILKIPAITSASFLITVFAMTKIVMMTTDSYPIKFENNDLNFPKIIGFMFFFFEIIALSILISLSGWAKSKRVQI